MPSTHHSSIIDRSAEQAHIWFGELVEELGGHDEQEAVRALRAVLHALRDRLSVAEAAQLAAQLPTLIRGIYYEEWRPAGEHHLAHDVDAFLKDIAAKGRMAGETDASHAVAAVSHVLHRHVSEGELADVLAILPPALRPLFRD